MNADMVALESRKDNTVPAASFLAARDNDWVPRPRGRYTREKGPLEGAGSKGFARM